MSLEISYIPRTGHHYKRIQGIINLQNLFPAQDLQVLSWSHIWLTVIESKYSRHLYSTNSRLWNFKLPWCCAPCHCGLEPLLWSPAVLRTPHIHTLCLIEMYQPIGVAIIGTFITFYCLSFNLIPFQWSDRKSSVKAAFQTVGTFVAWTPHCRKLWDNRYILF